MTVNKRGKSRKRRGSQTYGWGKKSRARSAGSHSGKGRCGLGKRGHCKKPTMLKLRHELGLGPRTKIGFKRHASVIRDIRAITLRSLVCKLDDYVSDKLVKKEKDMFIVNLRDIGFNKLLSNGKLDVKLRVTSDYFSAKAIDKIKSAGGEAIPLISADVATSEGKKADSVKVDKD